MMLSLSKQSIYNYGVILRSPGNTQDSYGLVGLGNLYLKKCQNSVTKGDLSSAQRNQEIALNYYTRVRSAYHILCPINIKNNVYIMNK